MKPVTRRDFLKGLAAGAVSVGAFGLAGTANTAALAEDASAVLYQPGTYSSTQATEFARDAGSTAGVDGISGASLCTAAIRDGVNACRAQALGVVLPTAPAGGAKVINPQSTDFHSNSSPDLSKTALFSDWQLGGRTFNHRMVKSAAFQLAFLRHNPDEYINYYKRMADGGVQMIWIEDFADIWEVTSGGPFKAPLDAYDVKGLVDTLHAAGCTIGYQFDTMGAPIGPLDFTEPFLGNYDTDKDPAGLRFRRL